MLAIVLLVLGLVLLVLFAVRSYRALRSLRSAQKIVVDDVNDRVGLLKARVAGMRVRLAQRRHRAID
jgi:hypothetical protein